MALYRNALPQLGGGLYLTDGGIETTLIFHEGLELPDFVAFHLLRTPEGEAALLKYFRTYAEIARRFATGLILLPLSLLRNEFSYRSTWPDNDLANGRPPREGVN